MYELNSKRFAASGLSRNTCVLLNLFYEVYGYANIKRFIKALPNEPVAPVMKMVLFLNIVIRLFCQKKARLAAGLGLDDIQPTLHSQLF